MKEDMRKYVPLVVLVALVILSFFIVKSYIIPLISAFILAHLARPIYRQIKKYFPEEPSAIATTLLIVVVIILPLILIAGNLASQSYQSLNSDTIRRYAQTFSELSLVKQLNIDVDLLVSKGLSFFLNSAIELTRSLPQVILGILITILGIYYLLIEWPSITQRLEKYLPIENKKKVIAELGKTTNALVYGTVFIAILEFCIALLGLWLANVKYMWLLSVIIALSAFIPGIGPGIVWIPLAIVYLFEHHYVSAAIIIVMGFVISIGIDFILRTKITSRNAKIHPLLVLIGILGGVSLFGIFGFIIGPLIVGYTVRIVEEILE